MIFATAVFIGMFIGREYSDGAVRNKLAVGHGRGSVYLSNLIVCAAADIMGLTAALAVTFGIGVPLIGTSITFSEFLCCFTVMILAHLALISVFLLAAMLISVKSAQVAVLIVGSFVMLFASAFISSRLAEPEYDSYTYVSFHNESGEPTLETVENEKNPYYISGTKRSVYEFFDSFLPVSQLLKAENSDGADLTSSAIYDIIILAAVTEAGVLLFCKKDIK
ncbi:MAG: ABC transporter permease [Bacteroides sp.]|nr:ABC transporter permease [Bacteroides sp.]